MMTSTCFFTCVMVLKNTLRWESTHHFVEKSNSALVVENGGGTLKNFALETCYLLSTNTEWPSVVAAFATMFEVITRSEF
jgi:hypothetical protein